MSREAIAVEDVAALVRKQLGSKLPSGTQVTADSTLEGLGLSSLDVTEVYLALEERVGMELDPAAAADVETVGELVDVVNRLVAEGEAQAGVQAGA